MPMTISDTSEDTLGNEDLEIFDGDVDVQSAVIDAIQDTDNVYDSYSETETLDYPVSEYAREVHQSSDDLQKQYEQRENSIAAPDESEEEIADDDLFDDDADKQNIVKSSQHPSLYFERYVIQYGYKTLTDEAC